MPLQASLPDMVEWDDTSQRDRDVPEFTVAEYFAGIGLVRLGLELAKTAKWRVVFANDNDPAKYQMYSSYFSDASEHYTTPSIFDLEPKSVPSTMLATSSFPCIDLSLAGNQNGLSGKHSSAFWGLVRILQRQKDLGALPPLVMLENVPGWLTSNGGQDFRTTVRALNDLGYLCDVFSLDAICFTPQSRLRVFLVGVYDGSSEKSNAEDGQIVDRFASRGAAIASNTLKRTVQENSDLRWRFMEDVPEPPAPHSEGMGRLIEILDDSDPRWWSDEEVIRHVRMMTPTHEERVKVLRRSDQYHYRTVFRRRRDGQQRAEVRDSDTAGCLRTARGGSSRQIILQIGRGQIRMRHMTPREYARLQGVPDDYPIPANIIQALTGFGDAVCVPLISWIADNILYPLALSYGIQQSNSGRSET